MGDSETLRELYEARRLSEACALYMLMRLTGPVTAEDNLYGGLAALRSGSVHDANDALKRAIEGKPSGETLGKALMTHGVVLRQIGDASLAIQTLEEFLRRMDEYPELIRSGRGPGYYNLGMAYRMVRRPVDALKAYDIAIDEFRSESLHEYLREALWSRSWLLCLMEDAEQAEADLIESEPLCDGGRSQWVQMLGWAFVDSVAGRGTEALQKCEAITSDPEPAPPDVVCHAYWISGRVALAGGHLDVAEALSFQAATWAVQVGDARCIHDVADLRRSILLARQSKQTEGA